MKRGALRKSLTLAGAALALAVALTYALWPVPAAVDTGRVTRGPLQITIDEDGEIRAHDRYVITAPITGRLLRVELHEGDQIKGGQVIAVLVPVPMTPGERASQRARVDAAEAIFREAQARAAHARADYEQARRNLDRGETLLSSGAMSRQEVEQMRTMSASSASDLTAARARETSAAADVRVAMANLKALEAGQPVEVRAPVNSVLLRIEQQSERVVLAGAALMVLADPSRYELVVDVLSTDAVKISPGMRVSVVEWGGPLAVNATVRTVGPGAFTKVSALGVEEQRVHIVSDLVNPPGRLSDGFRVQGRVIIWDQPDVLKLPIGALFRCSDHWCAFIVRNGKAVQRIIQIGQRNAEEAQILDGLEDHDTVVTYPPTTLSDGMSVRPLK
ncbi:MULTISPECIES: efflux RND transporter periplasmic adaptor subunit [Ralstonia]|uniref:HlyD family efflux transporter periplasmic adaptor subunit n=1 Tax=Ralstonia mojiangensis TaxID=2953895 RepID=A0AAE3I737_9RALS|nr:HlyD family efflux transporter periplasmic adaptor subunit [Ralstonia mojiangensis]MCO5414822.1 HlyD family efflux transporter periplasmic adaptor subunit [Ralstonia mojiangensis]MCT7299085.1 HlyD family efflux transporter periplasmic adaptor subunit [Ralstonia mojiangensis]MCT7314186.1 HlyD family efflux transporter periplasmic adaptor subunit [Ralstonia mojiangensis]MCT7318675.1 HlyD family efflux transporter periplasmic adaptor subunit [Ralstonia mojiangensis]MCT7329414.1 HlyD family eff